MKSKEEILKNYYTYTPNGEPEISADKLLQAMEDYREQTEANAFDAGRLLKDDKADHIHYLYPTFADYKLNLERETDPHKNNIKLVADSILPQFLPDDPNALSLSFNFKTGGKQYSAFYTKNPEGYWEFNNYT
ncbi:hypothetical protein [Mucilaginibacter segetis]|uniref:Uncharacterized protein n=1 Tax=Mucilaginibacter segetis TaxID=2793071 RepID=A0A934PWU2_9SPHI|nr:hypothetical protein [Mucilaginibacter segetis]MBK0380972.1 hypothetical protein [Mucilaginibacter segetis]